MNSPLIIAHRGDSRNAPENTMAAFRAAIECGADGVELDVQLASDDVPVVIHDYDLRRTGGVNKRVAETPSKELTATDVGSWFDSKFADETVPTLEQVLTLYEQTNGPIFVELKCESGDFKPLVAAVARELKHYPALNRVIVKSFRLGAIAEIKFHLPEVKTAALFEPSIMTILRRRKYIIPMAREFNADGISLHTSLASANLVADATAISIPVTIWTADNARWVERCRARKIDNLITNDPARLLAARNAK